MGIAEIAWVFKQPITPSSLKFLLVALADCANEGKCWPSVDTLSEKTSQNRKTILSGIKRLIDLGHLVDTGERKGKTGQVKVYIFCTSPISNSPENTIPKTELLEEGKESLKRIETVPFLPSKSPENGNSPTPPIKKELLLNHKGTNKHSKKKGEKFILEDWEKMVGSELRIEMLQAWLKENNLDPACVKTLIGEFRESVRARGNLYADFVSAFQVWLRKGYLSISLAAARQKSESKKENVTFFNKGLSL